MPVVLADGCRPGNLLSKKAGRTGKTQGEEDEEEEGEEDFLEDGAREGVGVEGGEGLGLRFSLRRLG